MFELFSSFRPFEFIIIVIIIIAKKMDVNFERDDWNEEKKGKKKQSREREKGYRVSESVFETRIANSRSRRNAFLLT